MGSEKDKQLLIQNLIEDNQGLVYHLAMRIHRSLPVRHELDDLVGYGMVGLAEAAKKFEPQRGLQFSTFAFRRIQGSIYDGLAKVSWMSRARYRRYLRQNSAEQAKPEDETGANADEDWGETEATVQELTSEQIEQLSDSEPNASAEVAKRETASILCEMVEQLPPRENRLITMVYFEGLSLQEAGDRLGVSKSWASRLHAKTIEKLGVEMKSVHNDASIGKVF